MFEHLQLKYISFIAKHFENSVLSYYELKKLLFKNNKISFFFQLISNVYSQTLEDQIILIYNQIMNL